jgi:hypothetical protein
VPLRASVDVLTGEQTDELQRAIEEGCGDERGIKRLGGPAMTRLTLEMPDEVFGAIRDDPDHFKDQMRLAAAVTWYREGRVSQEVAAGIAGLDRTDFLLALARAGHDSFVVDWADLDRELARE